MNKFRYKFAAKVLLRKLRMLTVEEAQWLLRLYRSEHDGLCLRGSTGKLYGSSSATLSIDWTWIKPTDFALSVPTRFEGGPAGVDRQRAYYNGTLVTFLVDRIMLRHQRLGSPLAWLVRFDPNSCANIWDQLKDNIPDTLKRYSTHPETAPKQKTLFDLNDTLIESVREIDGLGAAHPHSDGYDRLGSLYEYNLKKRPNGRICMS